MKKKIGNALVKDLKWAVSLVIIAILLVIMIVWHFFASGDSTVTNEYLEGVLQKSSELTTAKLTYTGWTKYTDGGHIPLVTKGGFIMVYKATVSAGIDLDKVEVSVDRSNKIINLVIPKAEVKSVDVLPDTIQYFDEKFKLLDFSQKEDANEAQALAKEKAKEEVESMGILEMADEQSEALVKGLLANVAEDYTFNVTMKEEKEE